MSHAFRATQDGWVIGEKVKESEVTQSCPTLCDPMACSLPGSSVHGIFQARVLEWSAVAKNPMNSMKRQNDRILKEEPPRSVGAQYTTGDQWIYLQKE